MAFRTKKSFGSPSVPVFRVVSLLSIFARSKLSSSELESSSKPRSSSGPELSFEIRIAVRDSRSFHESPVARAWAWVARIEQAQRAGASAVRKTNEREERASTHARRGSPFRAGGVRTHKRKESRMSKRRRAPKSAAVRFVTV